MTKRETIEERFWAKVNFFGPTVDHVPGIGNCWVWTAGANRWGYGRFWLDGRNVQSHRTSWMLSFGVIPIGLRVLHRCDNRPCVNPAHLWLGTLTDNMQDMISKGRKVSSIGERHGSAKLTEDQVREIRRRVGAGEVQRSVALAYGVCPGTVCLIVHRANWAHVI